VSAAGLRLENHKGNNYFLQSRASFLGEGEGLLYNKRQCPRKSQKYLISVRKYNILRQVRYVEIEV